ncbi:MAG: anaerobic ribonucleoside-triphosphate reductase activating protein [Methanophagales archaeon ANME-1-THS]|nr:MAG: anaerobic ribonucleoside-triphosphate reductase activating protein [Methanophagales archaeon ANME-1-THS]
MMATINLGGIVPVSTIDWRGKTAMVLFLRGCPLRCLYCQNYNLLEGQSHVELEEIESEIEKTNVFIDAVVLTGGEPFMQPEALEAIAQIAKRHALSVGVQTNGFYTEIIKSMVNEDRGLIDKIFLDIKAPLSDARLYERLTRVSGVAEQVRNTLEACTQAKIDLELVTTVFKHLVGAEEVKRIARDIEAAGVACYPYVLQQGRPEHVPGNLIKRDDLFTREELRELAADAYLAADLKDVRIRTKEHGEEVIERGGYDKW